MTYNIVDSKSIDVSLWVLKNINKIRMVIKILLGFFTAVIYVFLIINLANFIEGGLNESSLYASIFKNSNLGIIDNALKNIAPEDLYRKEVGAFPGYTNKYYDFYVLVENKNSNYYIDSIEYYFTYNNGNLETEIRKDFVGINSEKFLFVKGVEVPNGIVESPKFEIKNINWRLVDRGSKNKQIANSELEVPRNCFSFDSSKELVIKDKIIVPNTNSETGEQINSLNFVIKNKSFLDLEAVNNKIIYYNFSGEVIGVFEKEIYKLNSGKEKFVDILISPNIRDLATVEIIPEVNFCSEDAYVKYK